MVEAQLAKTDSVIKFMDKQFVLQAKADREKDEVIENLEIIIKHHKKELRKQKLKSTLLNIGLAVVVAAETADYSVCCYTISFNLYLCTKSNQMNKLTEEEFKEIKEMQENFQNAKLTLGDLEITKKSVLDQVGDMKVQFAQIESSLIREVWCRLSY